MKQVIIIHGGDSFSSYEEYIANLKAMKLDYNRLRPARRWKDVIIDSLQDADILTPSMPNKDNAQFEEWAIMFEKLIPFFNNDTRLIGHSLGAMFLAKYLRLNPLETPVRQLILLAGGYNEDIEGYGQFTVKSATGIEKSAESVHIMHSEDDPVVPYAALDKYARDVPHAIIHRFKDRNHFLDADFPELIELLKQK